MDDTSGTGGTTATRLGRGRGNPPWRRRSGLFKGIFALVQSTLLATSMLVIPAGVALAANPSADLDQCANGPAPSAPTNGCNPDEWVNGNLNAAKSVYREGDSIPYRMKFDNLSLGSHLVIIEWDTTKSGKHAIDYLTTWNRTVADANPCVGVAGCAASTTFAIPNDPQVTGGGVTPVAGVFTLFGGSVTSVSAYSYPTGAGFTGDKSAQIAITFNATVANPVLAWGGHIATRADWGMNNSAVAIPGSPYHMRLIDLDGAGGNQDRSLSEDAVIFPGSITIIKDATPNGSTSFGFTASPAPLSNFSLVDDGTSANTRAFTGIIDFQSYTVTETLPGGWQLDNRDCVVTSANGGSVNEASPANGVTIGLKEGENVSCTFSNSELPAPSLNVVKTATSVDGDNSAPFLVDEAGDVITYSIVVTNTGNVTLHNVSVNDPLLANEDCDGVAGPPFVNTGFTLAAGASLNCTGTYTVTQADIDNNGGGDGDIDNVATADSDETGPDTDDETVPLSRAASLDVTKDAAESSVDAAGDVINYTIVVTNTGNTTLTGVSIDDPLLANEDCDGVAGVPFVKTGFTLAPGATLTCTGTYTVTQADIDNNGGGDGDIDNTVTADSNETGPDTASEEVPIVRNPGLNVTKDAAESSVDAAGDVIHYTIQVFNTGNVTLTGVSVNDPLLSNEDCDGVAGSPFTNTGITIPVGGSITCTGTYTVTQADIDDNGGGDGDIDNTVTADSNETGPDTASEVVPIVQNPGLEIDKVDETGTYDEVGDVIEYSIVVTNTGNTTLTDVLVTDPNASDLVCLPSNPVASLAPGAQITCTAQHVVTQDDLDAGSYWNQACVDDGEGGADEVCDDVTTTGEQDPELSIDKVDLTGTFDQVGDVISYTIVATNTGNVTLHDVVVTDPNVSDLACTPTTPVDLAPGEQISCTASHTVTQEDIDAGSFWNQACVDDGQGGADKACDDVTTTGEQNPELSIDKVDETGGFDSVGDVIDYSIVATNTGNVTLHDVVVTDPNVSDLECTPATPVDLAPGESISCTASHTVTQDDLDAGSFWNQACADDGEGDGDAGANAICDDVTTKGEQDPELSIDKVDETGTYDEVGDVIEYSIVVENTGNVTLHDVVVTDAQVTDLECTPTTPVDLAPGESITCTASHTVTQDDLDVGSFWNQACADDGAEGAAAVCDDVTTTGEQDPELSIDKVDDGETFSAVGDVIDYTIVATNTGNVTLHGVVVTDDQVSDLECTPATPVDLAPGESITCTASHTVSQEDLDAGSFWNEACVDDTEGPAAEVCDDVTTTGEQKPALDILKEVAELEYTEVGQVLHYTITATNIGNVTLHDVVVTDAQVTDLECTPATPVDLAPGESITCTASHTVTQEDLDAGFFFNQACVDDGEGGADEACDDVTTPGQQTGGETDIPTLPPTDSSLDGGNARPADSAWLLVFGLGLLLAVTVLLTPRRGARQPR